ncbi:MAG: HipA domain-containing protein [Rikenellaceae bacterium]
MTRCLKCYEEIIPSQSDFHPPCAQDLFGAAEGGIPLEQIQERYDISARHPELRDLTMRLAQATAILCVPHTLYRHPTSGVVSLTKRLDEGTSGEDCDVDTIRLILDEEADTYRDNGSYEQIAQIVEEHSTISKLDVLNFWEQLAFGWVAGCSELGAESFALYQPHRGLYTLAPAFDLIATAVLNPNPQEHNELKLTLNRKHRNITRSDFEAAMKKSGIKAKIINGLFARFVEAKNVWFEIIDNSFVDEELKAKYKSLLSSNISKL